MATKDKFDVQMERAWQRYLKGEPFATLPDGTLGAGQKERRK